MLNENDSGSLWCIDSIHKTNNLTTFECWSQESVNLILRDQSVWTSERMRSRRQAVDDSLARVFWENSIAVEEQQQIIEQSKTRQEMNKPFLSV